MANAFAAMNGLYLEDLKVGMSAMFGKTVTEADIMAFAGVSGDTNPIHLHDGFARSTRFGQRIAHGMLSGSFISAVLGTRLPGPGRTPLKLPESRRLAELNSRRWASSIGRDAANCWIWRERVELSIVRWSGQRYTARLTSLASSR